MFLIFEPKRAPSRSAEFSAFIWPYALLKSMTPKTMREMNGTTSANSTMTAPRRAERRRRDGFCMAVSSGIGGALPAIAHRPSDSERRKPQKLSQHWQRHRVRSHADRHEFWRNEVRVDNESH